MIPSELTNRKQWLIWRFENYEADKKPRKVPYYASDEPKKRHGKQGSDSDRAGLVTYDEAMRLAEKHKFEGVGFAFLPDDGLIGIDLDGCFNLGDDEREKRARDIISACNSYTEYSPSGNGVHIICYGKSEARKGNHIGVEIFCGNMFLTFTGKLVEGTPPDINKADDGFIQKLLRTIKEKDANNYVKSDKPTYSVGADANDVELALSFIPADCGYSEWIEIGMAIHSELGPSGYDLWDRWSATAPNYHGGNQTRTHYKSFKAGGIGIGTLFHIAKTYGYKPKKSSTKAKIQKKYQVDENTGEILTETSAVQSPDVEQVRTENNGFFTCLGYDREQYYLFSNLKHQIIPINTQSIKEMTLISLAPISFWETYFPGNKTGFDYKTASQWIMTTCVQKGFYDQASCRGRGAWRDDGRTVYHLGNQLWVDGVLTQLSDHKSEYIYEMQGRMKKPPDNALSDNDGLKIIEICDRFRWRRPASAPLLAGWIALAPVCGALNWRPHIWITGGAGSGKSTILNSCVHPLMNNMALFVQGNSTEAGIRQSLTRDAIPVLIDESEQNNERERNRMQSIIALMRQASSESGAQTLKGTVAGKSMHFLVRSMFCLSSIQVGLMHQADHERISVLSLKSKHDAVDAATEWSDLSDALLDLAFDRELPGRLFRRSLDLLPITLQNIKVFSEAAARKFGNQRDGDQYGTLMAGCWSLYKSELVTFESAKSFLDLYDFEDHVEHIGDDESENVLDTLLGLFIKVEGRDYTVGELLRLSSKRNEPISRDGTLYPEDVLRNHGLRIIDGRLFIANRCESLDALFKSTRFGSDFRGLLKRLPGAISEKNAVRVVQGRPCKCISVTMPELE